MHAHTPHFTEPTFVYAKLVTAYMPFHNTIDLFILNLVESRHNKLYSFLCWSIPSYLDIGRCLAVAFIINYYITLFLVASPVSATGTASEAAKRMHLKLKCLRQYPAIHLDTKYI